MPENVGFAGVGLTGPGEDEEFCGPASRLVDRCSHIFGWRGLTIGAVGNVVLLLPGCLASLLLPARAKAGS